MSRNSNKLNAPKNTQPEQQQDQKPAVDNSNPFGLSFVVPTEDVLLPTEGKFYPASSPLCGVRSVEIKHMTAREEDLLSAGEQQPENENVFNLLINSLLTDKRYKAEEMHEEDKMAILLQARATGYGRFYAVELTCDECKATTECDFDLKKVSFTEPENEVDYDPDTDSYSITLPVSELEATVRVLTDKERSLLEREKRKKKELNIPFNMTVATVTRMLVSVSGVTQRGPIEKFVDVMPAADAKKVLNFNTDIFPRISTKQDITCKACGASSEREVPLTWAFFRIDI